MMNEEEQDNEKGLSERRVRPPNCESGPTNDAVDSKLSVEIGRRPEPEILQGILNHGWTAARPADADDV
jgi:hypothetical protein